MSDQNIFHHTVKEAIVNVAVASTTRGPTWTIEVKDAKPDELEGILLQCRDILSKLLIEQETEETEE